MTLVDTSVWVDHFRRSNARLAALLLDGQVRCHAFVAGELACGSLNRRREVLDLLHELPRAATLPDDEVMAFLELHALMNRGLGWVDVHLLASAFVSRSRLWTLDRRLATAAERIGVMA